MRIEIDLPDSQVRTLNDLAQRENRSRSALIRQAVDGFLASRASLDGAFGLWGKSDEDGLAYQKRLRDEW